MFSRLLIKQIGHALDVGILIVVGRPTNDEELIYPRLAGMEHRTWLSPTVSELGCRHSQSQVDARSRPSTSANRLG